MHVRARVCTGSVSADRLRDAGIVPPLPIVCLTHRMYKAGCAAFEWATPAQMPRVRAWVSLIVHKAASSLAHMMMSEHAEGGGAVGVPPSVEIARTWARSREVSRRGVRLGLPACVYALSTFTAAHAGTVSDALEAAALSYCSPATSWIDVTEAAWTLAGLETLGPSLSAAAVTRVLDDVVASPGVLEAASLVEYVQVVLGSLVPRAVDVGCVWGSLRADKEAVPCKRAWREVVAAARLDFIVTDVRGCVHLVQGRLGGDPAVHAATDMSRLRIVAAAEDVSVATITMAYWSAGSYVRAHIDAPALDNRTCSSSYDSAAARALARTSPFVLTAWQPERYTTYVWLNETSGRAWCAGERLTGDASFAEVVAAMRAPRATAVSKWVCWGVVKWCARIHAGAALSSLLSSPEVAASVFDIEAIVDVRVNAARVSCTTAAMFLFAPTSRACAPPVLDITCAATDAAVHTTDAHAHEATACVQVLIALHRGISHTQHVVYFWNGQPISVPIPALTACA